MSARPSPGFEVLVGQADDAQAPLPLASDGVRRWIWQSRFGAMLIEVIGDDTFVNGERVARSEARNEAGVAVGGATRSPGGPAA